jgi:uncharacterized protein (TIGR00288 family)
LIDFDNVTLGVRSDLQAQLKNLLGSEVFKGKISVQRAYADWRRYPQYIVPLSEASIDLIFAPAFGSNKKNATDIRLAIDALELVFTRPEIGTFVLISGDSDFSSLVLKLKEYGKYVIGVGIRESSSDLLIQNCDEYYGYSELTGLLKEGVVEHRRRDPWELVVEATTRMKQSDDVMRSDRLKQVMQQLDPNFDEKDAGFSKYSKFLIEATRRGVLTLSKMENGQYQVDLGENANVPLELEAPPTADTPASPPPEPEAPSRRRRSAKAGERTQRRRAVADGMPLSDAFDLLRKALTSLGAVGEEATDVEQARDEMIRLNEGGDDPVFEGSRFQRMLRQAHDADVIDLAKNDDEAYLLKVRPVPEEKADTGEEPPEERPKRTQRGGRARKRTETKKRAGTRSKVAEASEPEPSAAAASAEVTQPAPQDKTTDKPTRRNPRYRSGSRGGAKPVVKPDPEPKPRAEEPVVREKVEGNRSVRGRRGRGRVAKTAKGVDSPAKGSEVPASENTEPPARKREAKARAPRRDAQASVPEPEVKVRAPKRATKARALKPETEAKTEAEATPQEPAASQAEPSGEGLFKRMSAALQRAMLGPQDEDTSDGS